MTESKPLDHASGIASAPGDLPMPAIQERHALKASQFRHDNTIQPSDPHPDQPVLVTATSGAGMPITRAEVWYTTNGTRPDEEDSRVPMTRTDIEWTATTSYLYRWQATLPPQPEGTVVRYRIAGYAAEAAGPPEYFAHDGSGFWFKYGEAGLTTFAYRVRATPAKLPEWMEDAVIYHIFLDRFRNDTDDGQFPPNLDPNGKHGGTLRGVIHALPYLVELGVTCLWLSPVGPADTYHRYDQSDFFDVDVDLGGLAAMRELVAAAHAVGIRLILDYVPSHGSWKMPEFVAAQQDQDAPSASWFVFEEWPEKYRCFLGVVPYLVSFNGNDQGLRQFLIDSALFWLIDVGFDGLRLDHVIGHGTDFWVAFSTALERAKPDVAIFGEATDTPDMLRAYRGRMQGILDFPLAQIMRMSFGRGDWGVAELGGALQAHMRYMAKGPSRVTFFDNHDMNRLLFLANGDVRRLKLAILCLLTLPFPPILYYGTEIGLSQNLDKRAGGFGGDHQVRQDMPWDPKAWDQTLLSFTKAMIALRRQEPALRRGTWYPVQLDPQKQGYAYRLMLGKDEVWVYLNLNPSRQHFPLEPSTPHQILLSSSSENTVEPHGKGAALSLAGMSGVVLGRGVSGSSESTPRSALEK